MAALDHFAKLILAKVMTDLLSPCYSRDDQSTRCKLSPLANDAQLNVTSTHSSRLNLVSPLCSFQ